MSNSARVVADLLVTVAECRRELGRYAESVWLSHDFGSGSTLLSDLEIGLPGGSTGIRLGFTAQRWHENATDSESDDLDVELTIEVSDAGFAVQSGLTVLLAAPSGYFPAGSHVVHHQRSEGLDLAAALAAAEAHVAAFWDLDEGLAAFGLPTR
jgi:hypothetical protein